METADDSLVRRRRRQDLPCLLFVCSLFSSRHPLSRRSIGWLSRRSIGWRATSIYFISGLMEAKVVFLAADLPSVALCCRFSGSSRSAVYFLRGSSAGLR